jgi:hypothetical protein
MLTRFLKVIVPGCVTTAILVWYASEAAQMVQDGMSFTQTPAFAALMGALAIVCLLGAISGASETSQQPALET